MEVFQTKQFSFTLINLLMLYLGKLIIKSISFSKKNPRFNKRGFFYLPDRFLNSFIPSSSHWVYSGIPDLYPRGSFNSFSFWSSKI